jgi:hypothetical protein
MSKLRNEDIKRLKAELWSFYEKNASFSCSDAIDCLEELLALREENRWIPVSERLPEFYTHVLVYFSDRLEELRVENLYLHQHGWWGGNPRLKPTHWKPLPSKPEE